MGEVYRARDPRLGRDVAIKVLPAALRADPDRLRRFEHEARAAGALNHPNVVVVLDVGTHDGVSYVVSELLEGETLREWLRAGGLTVAKAVECAIQIALGLAAAHDKGIVHRDLKPANLFLTKDGRVKILDFGLAKLRESARGEDGSSTETHSDGTVPGAILGTAGYMSPEQVRALPADHRSDVFSFGAVLYEMLTKRRAFNGESAPEVMTAILKDDPPELSSSDRNIPPALNRIVRRCLEKRPEDRFQSARDIAFALEAITASPVSGVTIPKAGSRRWRRRSAYILGAGALLCALVFYKAGLTPQSPSASLHRLTFRRGLINAARLTTDGGTVIYSASWEGGGPLRVYSQPITGREASLLSLPQAEVLGISTTGEIALKRRSDARLFGDPRGTLARVPLAGTVVRDLLENVTAGDWSPDGGALAVARTLGDRTRLEYPIGKLLYETSDQISALRISPQNDRIAFDAAGDGGTSVEVVDLEGHHTSLSRGWYFNTAQVAWAPSGKEIWFTALHTGWTASLRAVTLSGQEREVLRLPGWMRLQDIARNGRVLLATTTLRAEMYGRGPGETRDRDLSWYDSSNPLSLSKDGRQVLFMEVAAAEGGDADPPLYLRGTDGSPAVRIGAGFPAALSPDARWIATCAGKKVQIVPTGPGHDRLLDLGDVACRDLGWFPDAERLMIVGQQTGHERRAYLVDAAKGKPQPLTPEGTTCGPPSPDAREVPCLDEHGSNLLYPVAGGRPRPLLGLEPGENVGDWSVDGKSLFVARWEGLPPLRIFLVNAVTGARKPWKEFQPTDMTGVQDVSVVATNDYDTYVYRYRRLLSDLYLIDGLR